MAASLQSMEDAVVATLVQLIVIILCARAAGAAARALRQPRAVGEMLAGLMLGPSLFGALFPEISHAVFSPASADAMQILSQIGLILLMFQIGSEFEFGQLSHSRNRNAVVLVAIASICVPLATGLVIGWQTAPLFAAGTQPVIYSLFVGVALAITAVPVLGRILREYALTRHETGVIAISAAAANDVVGWLLLAAVAAYASAQFSLARYGIQIAEILLFTGALLTLGRPAVDWLLRRFPVKDGALSGALIAIVFALIFSAGIATEALGIFTILGGFLVGLLFHRHTAFVAAWNRQIGSFVLIFFLPIFFTYTGLRTNVFGLDTASEWMWCVGIVIAATLSKIVPVHIAARTAGLPRDKALMLGVMMNTRGLMELIVLNVGLGLGFIPPAVFTMLVIMAVTTTIMTGPILQVLLRRAGHPAHSLAEA